MSELPAQNTLTRVITESMQRTGTAIPPIPPLGTRTQPTIPIPVPFRTTMAPTVPAPAPTVPPVPVRPTVPRSIIIAVPRTIITQLPPTTITVTTIPRPITPRLVVPPPPVVPRPTVPPVVPPVVPRPTVPPVVSRPVVPPPLARSPLVPRVTQTVPPAATRSPGRMTEAEEEQMRMAIKASLEETMLPSPVRALPRNPILSPMTEEAEIEEAFIQEAIDASMRATREAQLATVHANQITAAPASPRRQQTRDIITEQNREYEEALRKDQEKVENARVAAEAATRATAAAEEATRKLQEARAAEEIKKATLQPPTLQHLGTLGPDVYTIRFKLPNDTTVMHSFHRNEPLSSVLQQLRFDLKHTGPLNLTVPPGKLVICSETEPIHACGFSTRIVINVDYAENTSPQTPM